MERRHYTPRRRDSGLTWPLTIAVIAFNVTIGVKGFIENSNESNDHSPVTPAVDTLTPTPSPLPSETPVATLNGIPLPIQIYPTPTPTPKLPDIFLTAAAGKR